MSVRLRLYGDRVSQIFDLPDLDEQVFSFSMEKYQYGLPQDYCIQMCVLNNQWCFSASKEYEVLKDGTNHFERQIRMGDPLAIRFAECGVEVLAVMMQDPSNLRVSQKFILARQKKQLPSEPVQTAILSSMAFQSSAKSTPRLSSLKRVLGGSGYYVRLLLAISEARRLTERGRLHLAISSTSMAFRLYS